MEIVKDVGLTTCERGIIGQKARLLSWRSASGILPRGMEEEEVQVKVQVEEEEIGETHGEELGNRESKNRQHSDA